MSFFSNKMSSIDDWQVEMDHMLGVFEQQSESSLRKINGRFEVVNRPFDGEFKKRFLAQSVQRYIKIQLNCSITWLFNQK